MISGCKEKGKINITIYMVIKSYPSSRWPLSHIIDTSFTSFQQGLSGPRWDWGHGPLHELHWWSGWFH